MLIGGRVESGDGVGGVALHAGQHVLVDGHLNAGVEWPRRSLTTFNGIPCFNMRVAVGVAEIVQPDRRHTCGALEPCDCLRQRVGVNGVAVGAGEHGPVRDRPELAELVASPVAQHRHGAQVEVNRST